jgi:hypothetical protein
MQAKAKASKISGGLSAATAVWPTYELFKSMYQDAQIRRLNRLFFASGILEIEDKLRYCKDENERLLLEKNEKKSLRVYLSCNLQN